MRYRLLAAVFAACLVATGQSLSVEKLVAFLQSSEKLIAEGKMTDRDLGIYLSKVKLTERLEDRTIEQIQGFGKIGPKTLQALNGLRDRTQSLAIAAPILAPAAPTPIPPPTSEEQAAILDEVRQYALGYSKNLPDFICTQVTRRFAAPAPGSKYYYAVTGHKTAEADAPPAWQALDTLQIRLSYFEQKEDYKLIMVNSSPTTQDYKTLGGSTSTGDFGSMMREIFEPGSEARFEWDHWGTLRGRRVMAFSYRVPQERSQWHINYDRKLDIVPGYSGLVEVDKNTHEVMRVTLHADDIPESFPVRKAETVLDYDYQDISGHTFLLPLKAQVIMAANDYLTRNDEEFRIYRKYSASSDITFDSDEKTPPPPLTDDKTKETKDPKVIKK
ncbi:MAG TPA: hypothetical protein VKU19_28935 [Bryobacteraceae bacterium]|nr:hypothetical protein [Bryobacteraceae bacterium]